MTYPTIKAYNSYYVTPGDSLDEFIKSLISIKNYMIEKGMTTVKIDYVEHGLVSFRGERDITPEESSEYTRRHLSQEAVDRTTYVELKLKDGWS